MNVRIYVIFKYEVIMKYTETGFRPLYHNFCVFPLNEEIKKVDERSNSVLGTDKNSDANTPHFCTNCGTRYDVGAKFCRKCGNSLQES